MFRIDDPTASATLPAPSAAGTPGYFTGGDPATGEQPTTVTQDWANMVQEELMAIIVAALIAPDKTNRGQVLAAILKLIGTANFSPTGHVKISIGSNSFIMNWGPVTLVDSSGYLDVTFDLPFPTGILIGYAIPASGPANPSCWVGTGNWTATGMRVGMSIAPSGGGSGVPASTGSTAYYLALGH